MKFPRPPLSNRSAVYLRGVALIVAAWMGGAPSFAAGEQRDGTPERSENPSESHSEMEKEFAELLQNSPFLRRVDLSRALVLTGVADIEGSPIAILVDRETKESHFVTGEKNEEGWRLLGIDGDVENLETVSARIAVGGGEVISIGYDSRQIKPKEQVGLEVPRDQMRSVMDEARNYRRGLSADGFPREPPPDLVEKLSKMRESQRMRIIYQMRQLRNKGMGGLERQKVFRGLVDRASRGRR